MAVALSACVLAFGCSDEEESGTGGSGAVGGEGGMGGEGGSIAPITWTASAVTVVGDDQCEFFINPDTGDDFFEGETFIMEVDGSNVTLELAGTELIVGTDTYQVGDNPVVLSSTSTDSVDDCEAQLMEELTISLANPDAGFEGNQVVSVNWFHDEFELSNMVCNGPPLVWFVELPCFSEADLMLSQ
jgi:hypothetical protein